MLKKLVLLCFLAAAAVSNLQAQGYHPDDETPFETLGGRLTLQLGIPSEPMKRAIQNEMGDLGFGGALTVLTNPFSWGRNKRNSPLRIGGEVGYTYYGRFLSEVNINGYRGNYKTSYGIMQLNAVVQLRPTYTEKLTPFVEVLAGGNFYLSSTKENLSVIESALGIPSLEIDNFANVGFNKGVALGFSVGKPSSNSRFLVRVSYNVGSDIKYVVRNSLQFDPGRNLLTYQVGRVPVKYLMVQVGIGI